MGKDGWIHYVLLRWCDALQVNVLTHSHGQSFHHIRSTLDETSPCIHRQIVVPHAILLAD